MSKTKNLLRACNHKDWEMLTITEEERIYWCARCGTINRTNRKTGASKYTAPLMRQIPYWMR